MIKKIVILATVLILILGVGVGYLGANLDSLIKKAIVTYGSEATQTTVTLDHVRLKLADGQGALQGLSLSNPEGFSSAKAFQLGLVSLTLDPKSLAGDGPITVRELIIEKPEIAYEVLMNGTNNLQTIADNAQRYAAQKTAAIKGTLPASKSGAGESQPAAATADQKPSRKLIIQHLAVRDGVVAIRHELLKKPLTAPLPSIDMHNLGEGKGGLSGEQLTQTLIQLVTSRAAEAGSKALMQEIPTLKASEAVEKIGGQIKNLLGF